MYNFTSACTLMCSEHPQTGTDVTFALRAPQGSSTTNVLDSHYTENAEALVIASATLEEVRYLELEYESREVTVTSQRLGPHGWVVNSQSFSLNMPQISSIPLFANQLQAEIFYRRMRVYTDPGRIVMGINLKGYDISTIQRILAQIFSITVTKERPFFTNNEAFMKEPVLWLFAAGIPRTFHCLNICGMQGTPDDCSLRVSSGSADSMGQVLLSVKDGSMTATSAVQADRKVVMAEAPLSKVKELTQRFMGCKARTLSHVQCHSPMRAISAASAISMEVEGRKGWQIPMRLYPTPIFYTASEIVQIAFHILLPTPLSSLVGEYADLDKSEQCLAKPLL